MQQSKVSRTSKVALVALVLPLALGACAMKSDVRRLENEIATTRARQDSIARENARRDQALLDSVRAVAESDRITRGQLLGAVNQLSEQLNQVAILMGVSQQRLQQLIERQQVQEQLLQPPVASRGAGGAAAGQADPDSLYRAGTTALAEKSYAVARDYFDEIVTDHPRHERAADAAYQTAMAFQQEGDTAQAIASYDKVVQAYPSSARAPQALLNAGGLLEAKRDRTKARQYYNKIVTAYPDSDAVAAARTRLRNLR